MRSIRRFASLLALAIIAALAPVGAQAQHSCDTNVVIFSNPLGVNSNVARCSVDDGDDLPYDGRIINPGSTSVSVRYTVDLGVEIPKIQGVLNGLGFKDKVITLTRSCNDTLGFCAYDSANQTIPDGRTGQGCISAKIILPDDGSGEEISETNNYHTLGSQCPDYPIG